MSVAQQIPLTFRLSPLPETDMTPQQFADAMTARLTAESTNTISFFAAGSVAPTSNVGPWLKDNNTWYVWSDSLGTYVPETIPAGSLGYVAQQAPGPDHTLYTFWIQLDGVGKAQSVQYYYGAAWHDIYEDRFATVPTIVSMNAAIAAAVVPATNTFPAAADAGPTYNQHVNVDAAPHKITLGQAYINPDGKFDITLSRYVAPQAGIYRFSMYSQVDNGTGTASGMEILMKVYVNGAERTSQGYAVGTPPGLRWWPSYSGLIQLALNDQVEVWAYCSDGVNTGYVVFSDTVFSIELVK